MILAIDSSAATAVALTDPDGTALAVEQTYDRRSHAEVIGPLIQRALQSVSANPSDVTAVVMGVGPGPFTGLRVGIAAAQAFAWARGVPVWPVHSHDAAALDLGDRIAVASDARRGEWAVTTYRPHPSGGLGVRADQTVLVPHHDLPSGAQEYHGARVVWLDTIDPVGLVRATLERHARGESGEQATPMYLREPDVTMPQ